MKIFETSDYHLAITLCSLGFALQTINKQNPKRYVFEYEQSPDLMSYIEGYFKGELRLDPRLVLLNSKLLKDRMYEK